MKTDMSYEVVYVVKNCKQMFSEHRVGKIVLSTRWRTVETEKNWRCAVQLLMTGLL